MELSPFLSVSVQEKKHFMKCQWRRMGMFWERGKGKGFLTYNNILFIYKIGSKKVQEFNAFKERSKVQGSSNVQCP
jgi:hypothetical protein